MLVRVLATLAVLASLSGCAGETFEFVCESDMQCDEAGAGLCVQQWCAYPDDGCASGYRYSADAEGSVAEECVPRSDLPPE